VRDPLIQQQPAIKPAQTAQLARHRPRIHMVCAELGHKVLHVGLECGQEQGISLLYLLGKLLQVARIGLAGGRTHSLFNAETGNVFLHQAGITGEP
jgi:hypothetical protein